MDLKERLTQKVGPLPAWAWGVGVAGVIWVALKFRNRGAKDDAEVWAEDDPSANLYTLGPVAGAGMAPAGSYTNADESYVNPNDWMQDYLYGFSETNRESIEANRQLFEDYFWSTTSGQPDPYAVGLPTGDGTASLATSPPASGVTVQAPAALKKLMTWAEWNTYHSKLDKNWLKIPGATRQQRFYDYLRNHGATTLPGSGAPIPSVAAPAVAANSAPSTASRPSGASPGASTPASRAADRAKRGIFEFEEWIAYQVKSNKNFLKQTTAQQRRDRWRAYVVAHGGQWQ